MFDRRHTGQRAKLQRQGAKSSELLKPRRQNGKNGGCRWWRRKQEARGIAPVISQSGKNYLPKRGNLKPHDPN